MDYKELLNKCKQQPGWLASGEQKQKVAYAKYIDWVKKQDSEFKTAKKNQSK